MPLHYLNRVAVVEGVQAKRCSQVSVYKLCPDLKLGETVIHTEVLYPGGKSLIQPQVSPPFLELIKTKHR